MRMKVRDVIRAAALTTALVVSGAGVASASGGVNSGGVNSGGGGGGTPPPPAGPCATITSFSNSTGYYSAWAAIWTKFSVSATCSATWTMTFINGLTGSVDFSRSASVQMMPSGTIDEDWAAFSTPYTVTLVVNDAAGTVLDSRSAVVTTKPPKSGIA